MTSPADPPPHRRTTELPYLNTGLSGPAAEPSKITIEPLKPRPPRRPGQTAAIALAVAIAIVLVFIAGTVLFGSIDEAAPVPDRDEIRSVDFANIDVELPIGHGETVVYEMRDGFHAPDNAPGPNVGYHLSDGPVFADIDDDGHLDAAVLYSWVPAAGSTTWNVVVWRWATDRPQQIAVPVRAPYAGSITDLAAADDGFSMTIDYPLGDNDRTPAVDQIIVGLAGDDLAQIGPTFGSTDRCRIHEDEPNPANLLPNTTLRIAPHDDASEIGTVDEFRSATTIDPDTDADGWVIVELRDTEDNISCGYARRNAVTS